MKTICKMIILILYFLILSPIALMADGFIVTEPGKYTQGGFTLAVTDHRVKVKIDELAAETLIEQDFYNPARFRAEGVYLFPVPDNAAIDSFALYQNGRLMKSELMDSQQAARIYENIVRRMKDPALLEYSNRNLIRVKIYPFEPNETKSITIRYREILKKDNNRVFYSYPLNTEKFSSKPLKRVSVDIKIRSSHEIGEIICPYYRHETVTISGNEKHISYEDKNILPDRDFDISFSHISRGMNFSLLASKKRYEREGFFLLDITPLYKVRKDVSQDIIFVLDTSGSMRGRKIIQAKESLKYCIDNIRQNSGFQIIGFSSQVRQLFNTPSNPTKASLKKAYAFIDNLQPAGGTNIDDALKTALRQGGKRHRVIVFITDGKPTIGETSTVKILDSLKYSSRGTRIFTFGIGYDINTLLLDRITEETKAFRTYIKPDENILNSISSFFEKVNSPVLTDPEIRISGSVNIFKTCPGKIPDLFRGSTLVLTGRYSGSGNAGVELSGYSDNRKITHRMKLFFPDDDRKHDFLPTLWASKRIAELLDSIRLYGNRREKINEITGLATKYGIITPYTSFLILENERKDPPLYRPFPSPFKRSEAKEYNACKEKYRSMIQKDGIEGVQASNEIQKMKQSGSYGQKSTDDKSIFMKVRTVSGIQFWFNGSEWIDARLLRTTGHNYRKIVFLSEEYFELQKKFSEAAEIFSLGKNIRLILGGKEYHVSEDKR